MSNDHISQDKEGTIGINNNINAKISSYHNVDQNFITITEDKMELILGEYLEKIESKKSWAVPLGIFIPLLLIPFTTENFKRFLFIPAEFIKTTIYLGIIVSFLWLIVSIFKGWKNRSASIKEIINLMKKSEGSPLKEEKVLKSNN